MKLFAITVVSAVLAAGAATAQNSHIDTRDLNLSRPSDLAILDQRVETQARVACRSVRRPASRIPDTHHCLQAFRAEVERQIPPSSRYEYARVRSGRVAL